MKPGVGQLTAGVWTLGSENALAAQTRPEQLREGCGSLTKGAGREDM